MAPHSAESNGTGAAKLNGINASKMSKMGPPPRRVIPALPRSMENGRKKTPLRSVTPPTDKSSDESPAVASPVEVEVGAVEETSGGAIQESPTSPELPVTPVDDVPDVPDTPRTQEASLDLASSPSAIDQEPTPTELDPSLDIQSPDQDLTTENLPTEEQSIQNMPTHEEIARLNAAHPPPPPSGANVLHAIQTPPPGMHYSHPSMDTLSFGDMMNSQNNSPSGFVFPPPAPFIPGHQYHISHPPMMPPPGFGPNLAHNAGPMSRTGSQAAGSDLQSPVATTSSYYLELESTSSLKDHILHEFEHAEFFDCILAINDINSPSAYPSRLHAHSIILARSPIFLDMMRGKKDANSSADGLKHYSLNLKDKFLNTSDFEESLRYLYGEPLKPPHELEPGLRPFNLQDANNSPAPRLMKRALAHAAAGVYLQVPVIVTHSIECAKQLLRWDTIEHALAFALEGGLDSHWQSIAGPQNFDPEAQPSYGQIAGPFLKYITEFIVHNLPPNFIFFADAPQLTRTPRLPTSVESRPSISNPRLSLIQFGDMSSDSTGRPNFVVAMISSILVSLPFPVLKATLEHHHLGAVLGKAGVAALMHSVLEQREKRRTKVLAGGRVVSGGGNTYFAEALMFKELIFPDSRHGSGFTLARWVDDSAVGRVQAHANPQQKNGEGSTNSREADLFFGSWAGKSLA
ncbi:hypothetical protein EJ08DRAFT_681310 [Tothia fuscella]|uniref:BTB domain-containing protein n=1 Tax=Tothia fuscella TaxID=1048955 RepID=A0A9P4NLM7_9PEZI|nr:hypothetical protein EJ08DRAFT_681310 [Tothia fuscella]